MFSSSRLHIQLEKKIQTRVPSLQCHLLKVRGSLSSWLGGEETRAEARTGRKSLHLCSPLRRGNRASRGNRKPNRAMVRRIQAGRFCIWCLMSCGEMREHVIRRRPSNRISFQHFRITSRLDLSPQSRWQSPVNCGKPLQLKARAGRWACFHNTGLCLENSPLTRTARLILILRNIRHLRRSSGVLKVLYDAKITLPMFCHRNMCL